MVKDPTARRFCYRLRIWLLVAVAVLTGRAILAPTDELRTAEESQIPKEWSIRLSYKQREIGSTTVELDQAGSLTVIHKRKRVAEDLQKPVAEKKTTVKIATEKATLIYRNSLVACKKFRPPPSKGLQDGVSFRLSVDANAAVAGSIKDDQVVYFDQFPKELFAAINVMNELLPAEAEIDLKDQYESRSNPSP